MIQKNFRSDAHRDSCTVNFHFPQEIDKCNHVVLRGVNVRRARGKKRAGGEAWSEIKIAMSWTRSNIFIEFKIIYNFVFILQKGSRKKELKALCKGEGWVCVRRSEKRGQLTFFSYAECSENVFTKKNFPIFGIPSLGSRLFPVALTPQRTR